MTGRVASGATWSATGRLGAQVLQFIAGIALARLLLPADFGILASVFFVTGLTALVFDLGLAAALVHKQNLDDETMSTAFWMNALGGLAYFGILCAVGPAVADFFDDSRLRWITPVSGLSFTLSLWVVHIALLERELRFKALALAELGTALLANVAAVVAAAAGFGPYALLVGPALQGIALTATLWIIVPWRPSSFISRSRAKELWNFSGGLLGFGIATFAGRNVDNVLLGRYYGAESLGYYTRAYNLMLIPVQQLGQVMVRVVFPALTAMGNDVERVRTAYRRAVRAVSFLTFPILLGLSACAPALVVVLWGERWRPTIILLQLLCLAGIPQTLSNTEIWVYQSQGRTGLMFRMGLISTAGYVLGIVVGLHWGAVGVATGLVAASYLFLPVNLVVACSVIGLKARTVYRENAVTLVQSTAVAAAMWFCPVLTGLPRTSGLVLIIQVGVGGTLFVATSLLVQPSLTRQLMELRPRRSSGRRPANG